MATQVAKALRVWTQSEFSNVGQGIQHSDGDYAESTGLVYDEQLRRLVPLPAFEANTLSTGFSDIKLTHYSDSIGGDAFIYISCMRNSDNKFALQMHAAHDFSLDSTQQWSTTAVPRGVGASRHVYMVGENWYILGGSIFNGSDKAVAFFSTSGDFETIAAYGDRLYAALDNGDLYRLSDDTTTFELYLGAVGATSANFSFNIMKLFAYKQALGLVARDGGGRIHLFRIPDTYAQSWHALGVIDELTSDTISIALETCIGEKVIVLRGDVFVLRAVSSGDDYGLFNLYRFSGSSFEVVASMRHETIGDGFGTVNVAVSITSWKGHVLLSINKDIYIRCGSGFAVWKEGFDDAIEIHEAGDRVMATDGDAAFWNSSTDTFITGGEVITSRLEMDAPGTEKFLHSITVLLDAEVEDVGHLTAVYYRINNNSEWTLLSATGGDGGMFLRYDEMKVRFYLLQIRVVLNNSTTGRTGISAINATFTTA